jgi:pimeloyl-ACP methyl ester carboxylesterase
MKTVSWLVLAIAVLTALAIQKINKKKADSIKWHEGPKWEGFFKIYDEFAESQYYSNRFCESKQLESRFGSTQVHACGQPSDPAVLLLHGMGSCSVMYGDWIVPTLMERHYVVAIDSLCDVGRSLPRDGDPASCPQTRDEIGEWFVTILDQLGLNNNNNEQPPAALVGYSYGSFQATQIALAATSKDRVGKLILLAPTATFAPIETEWVTRIMIHTLMAMLSPTVGMQEWWMAWFMDYMTVDPNAPSMSEWGAASQELRKATDAAGHTVVTVPPVALEEKELKEMCANHPTLLVMGEGDKVVNATTAADTARAAGAAKVKVYPQAGHLLLVEHPREPVIQLIASFLQDDSNEQHE